MKGWIFGDEKSSQWTQSLFGKKFKFQNPLRQNYRHTKALAEFLGIDHDKIFSVVMFWGECEFKTPMPPNVLLSGYISYIKSRVEVVFSDDEVQEIVTAIRQGMCPKSWATRRQHVHDLKERFSSPTRCPRCGSSLVLRTAKTGPRPGAQFYGCSKFPRCRYIGQLESHG
jgi:restriction system protein